MYGPQQEKSVVTAYPYGEQLMCIPLVWSQDVVVTAQGQIRGVSQEGHISYTGIPYASVTLSADRFKRAGLAPIWSGVRESSPANCYPTSQSSDCLKLDVHAPVNAASPWPVIVWVTGGPGQYNPGRLVRQGVGVVTVHHRLGPSGFLCLQEEEIPGNAGAKDLVLALRWVRDNIVAFKGNPAKVIVAGQSFGAAMVEALTLSPMAQGLFHGVILQSGTALSPWAFNYDAGERAKLLGALINDEKSNEDYGDSYNGDARSIASVFLEAGIGDLTEKSKQINKSYFPFGLCTEKAYKTEELLLSESPFELLSKRKTHSVPMIIGYNSDEAYIFVSSLKGAAVLRRMARDISFLLPEELKFYNEREKVQVARELKELYFKNNISMASVLAYHRDAYFLNHIHRSVRLHTTSSHQPVYFYQFSHSGAVGVSEEPGVKKTGAAHSDELAYLFAGRELAGDDGNVQLKLVKLWTNFAKYLTPTPKLGDSSTWDPAEMENLRVLNIGPQLRMEAFAHGRAQHMWDDIYYRYYYSRYRTATP